MVVELDFLRSQIPGFGVFRDRRYDQGFTIVMASVVVAVIFSYVRWMYIALIKGLSGRERTPTVIRCFFCENSNQAAVVDPTTDLCQSCGQLNAFDDDGDYARPIPELYHAQMNKKLFCETPKSRVGLPTGSSPQPATAPGNLLCSKCIDNQDKIVSLKANFVAKVESNFDQEFDLYARQLERDYALCTSCQKRVQQFVHEQDKQIAATVASSSDVLVQNRLFMAKHMSNGRSEDPVFVPSSRVYRRQKLVTALTLASAFFPLFWGPLDLPSFWALRIFSNLLTLGFGSLLAITSPYRRVPLTPIAVLCLTATVLIDLLAIFYYLKFLSAEDLASYHLKSIADCAVSVIEIFPLVVTFFAFSNAASLLPHDKKSPSSYRNLNRQNSLTSINGSPAPSEPYVTSLLAETVVTRRPGYSKSGMTTPWKSSARSSYTQSNYSPFSSASNSPHVRRSRPAISTNPFVHFAIAGAFVGAMVIYLYSAK